MTFINSLVNIVLSNEFPHSKIDTKFVSSKVIKILQNGTIEIKLFLYSSLFFYFLTHKLIFSITRSKFMSYKCCNIIAKFPVVGKGINLFLSLIRSSILEINY